MKISSICIALFISLCLFSCKQESHLDLSSIDPGRYDSTWYNRAPMRFIQTNLRETDASMDVDSYVQSLLEASANVVIFNVGGIRAFYPTKLPYHYKSPFLKGDLVGEVIDKFHQNGIKFVARFDMSKVHETVAAEHPDWLYVGADGKVVNYNGEVHTCITGGYQQEYAFQILEEAISTYHFDGLFFNNPGFSTVDYSLVNHGICQCANCLRGFRDSTGLKLPVHADESDPVFQRYKEWQQIILSDYARRVKVLFHKLDPDLVYFNPAGQVYRSESGTPFTTWEYWTYHGTENTKKVLGSRKDQMAGDTYNYLLGMDYRHTATSPNVGRIFLTQHMLNGAGPGIYFIGHLENQLDRVAISGIKELFAFHKKHEKLFTNVQSVSKIALVLGDDRDYRGIMRMLTEEHLMYDLIKPGALGSKTLPRELDSYDVLILSHVTELSDQRASLLDDYVKNGGRLLLTGFPGTSNGRIKPECLGVNPDYEVYPRTMSTYLKVTDEDRSALGSRELADFDVIMMNSAFLKCQPKENAISYFNLVPNTMHGPPEKCYFTEDNVTNFPGMVEYNYGKGKTLFIPWKIGAQYNWRGNNAHRALFLASLRNLTEFEDHILTDYSPMIEMTHMANRKGAFEWIGLINHSGQIGDVFREPVPILNCSIRFKTQHPVKSVHLVKSGRSLKFEEREGWIECRVPKVEDFEMILCQYK